MTRHAKPSRTRTAHPAAPSKRRPFPIAALIAGLALAGVTLIVIWLIPVQEVVRIESPAKPAQASGIPTWTVGMLRPDGLRIVVTGSNDASKVLDPQGFSRSDVRHGYWVAAQIPEVLNKLYCWCGCENRDAAKIQAAVDVHWGPNR